MLFLRPSILWLTLTLLLPACKKPVQRPSEAPVVIIGGGIAGLTTAYALQKRGIRSHVLEERPVFGGRVATATYAVQQTGEYGMQEMWSDSPLINIARELNVRLDGPEPAFSSMVLDGHLEPYIHDTPAAYFAALFEPKVAAALDAWRAQAAVLYERAKRVGLADAEVAHLQTISLTEWIDSSALPPRAAQWVRNSVEVEMSADAHDVSALSALLDMEMFFGDGLTNWHVHGGNSQLIAAMVGALHENTTWGATVTAVHRVNNGFDVRYEQDHIVRTLHAQRVVVAVPFIRLHQLYFEPALPADIWSAVNSLRLGQYTVVHFLTDPGARALWKHGDESPFPVLAGPALGAIYGAVPQGAVDAGDVFSVLLFGQAARGFHLVPRDSKIAELKAGLDGLWPGFSHHVRDAYVYTYHPTALPVWPPGRSSLDALAQTLRADHNGLYFAGDYTQGAHATSAAESGLAAAEKIVRSGVDGNAL